MILLILLALTFFIQLFSSVWYSLAERTKGKEAAFKFRLLCSSLYIADITLSLAIAFTKGSVGIYSILLLIGFLLIFAGDILYSKIKKGENARAIMQIAGNIFLLCGFLFKANSLFPKAEALTIPFILAHLTVLVLAYILIKVKFKKVKHIEAILTTTGLFILMDGLNLGIRCQASNIPALQSLSFAVIFGTLIYVISILINAELIKFKKNIDKNNLYESCLHFFGLMIIACTIALIGG